MKRVIKACALGAVGAAILAVSLWGAGRAQAYDEELPVPDAVLDQAFDAAVHWLVDHEPTIVQDGNAMLWRMVREAGVLSGRAELVGLTERYRQEWAQRPENRWRQLFDPSMPPPSVPIDLTGLFGYQRLFAHALRCDPAEAAMPDIRRELSFDRCSLHLLRAEVSDPACVTHQLMGFMLLKQARCGDMTEVQQGIRLSQDRVERELEMDFRVTDAYVQRVLMLYRTGEARRVSPAWLRAVLKAQRADGGWAKYYRLPFTPGGQALYWKGLGDGGFGRGEVPASFHTTAQAVLLLALARAPDPGTALQTLGWTP